MFFNKKIQIFFFRNEFTFKNNTYVHYGRRFMNKISIFSFGQIMNKI